MKPSIDPGRILAALLALGAAVAFAACFSDAMAKAQPKNPHGAFQEECGQCHSPEGWSPARIPKNFDHGRFGLPLTGAHQRTPCRSCHGSLDFAREQTPCAGCHEDVHRGELGADCAGCHSTRSFIDRSRMEKQHQITRFPLTGAHLALDCESCHPGAASGQLNFVQRPTDCEDCHRAQALAVSDPDHSSPEFNRECDACHGTVGWDHAVFDHAGTAFPLTGAHLALACASCHTAGTWQGLPTTCAGCHQGDYDATTDPNHIQLAFPLTCSECHTTTRWSGAVFDHAKTAFPLTGAHLAVDCASCHTGGIGQTLPTACTGCHQPDYDATTNPNHLQLGFPVTCAECHTTLRWEGATFDHDTPYFPIYSGTHRGRWSDCFDCHVSTADYKQYNCLNCHPHDDKADTDAHHEGETGYQYDSAACYSCHPRGTH